MKTLYLFLILSFSIYAQPYQKAKTRHRFAQSTLGLDLCAMAGGNSVFANTDSTLQTFNIHPSLAPRIHMGGLHFWGHLEFFFNINLGRISFKKDPVKVKSSVGDAVGLKYFPLAVKFGRPAFYIGTGLTGVNYRQTLAGVRTADYNKLVLPATLGLFYFKGKTGFDVSFTYLFGGQTKFYASKKMYATIQTPPLVMNIGIRKMFETTLSAEKYHKSGKEDSVFKLMRKQNRLSSWFFGIAPSSAFYLREPENNGSTYSFMGKGLFSFLPELALGYYSDPLRVNLVLTSRYSVLNKKAFDIHQKFERMAVGFESYWQFANYNGFAPYAGVHFGYEMLHYKETNANEKKNYSYQGFKPGVVAGWDILVSKYQPFTLRTNVRYFPNLGIDVGNNKKVWLDQIEFNFIELVYYVGRSRKLAEVWYE